MSDEWMPAHRGGRGGRRWGRAIGLVLLVVVALPVVFGAAVALRTSSSIDRIPVETLTPHRGGPVNVLVIGSDSRADLSEEQRRELTTGGDEGGERTDTIFVLQVEGGSAALLAFPRDLWVTRCDGREQRINTAVQAGGPACLVETIQELSGIDIHHVMVVSFLGFVDIVEAVGGVEVCLDSAISDRDAGIDLPAGCQILGGADALGFVRVRKIDNDLQRIERQQQFVRALASRMSSPATLLNPLRVWRVSGEIGGALTADDSLGVVDLARLGWGLRGVAAGNLNTVTVPVTDATRGEAAVLLPTEAAEEVFRAFRAGELLGSGGTAELQPEDVSVVVLNGAGRSGLAGQTRELLTERGYEVVEIGNAPATDRTEIRHPGDLAAAELLARDVEAAIGVAPAIVESAEVTAVTLVLGSDLPG